MESTINNVTEKKRIICPLCGNTDVRCQAIVNPNSQCIESFPPQAFENGKCITCKLDVDLIDVTRNLTDIDNLFAEYVSENNEEPRYADCLVTFTDDRNYEEGATIKLSSGADYPEDTHTFYFCNGIESLKSLCEKGVEPFIIRRIYQFT